MFYLVILFSYLFSFHDESRIVNSIEINGNQKTKDYIIKREILHNIDNALLDSTILQNDINRLYNLGIFSKVEIIVQNNIYTINVIEGFNVYPIPLIEYNETKDELSYGPAIAHSNFLGTNQKVLLGSFLKGDTGYILGYYNPWVCGDRINLGFLALNINPQNIFYDYNYNYVLNKISSGFSLDEINRYNYELGYLKIDILDIPNNHQYYNEIYSKPFKYDFFNLTLNYQYDIRDIYIDPEEGHLFDLSIEYFHGINEIDDIWTISMLFKKYYSIKTFSKPVISYKIHTKIKFPEFDKLPFLSYEYLGGEEFVRGYSSLPDDVPKEADYLMESSNIYMCSFEIQNTIIERKDFGQVEFGLDGLIFFDMGTSSKIYNKIDLSSNIYGYGFGLKFFISSVGPITVSVGYNPYGQRHLHLMDGQ